MQKKYISQAVVNRIPKYYRNSLDLLDAGVTRISSKALAERMGLTASQIRQDFNCFGGFGQQGYGYNVESLRDELSRILGIKENKSVIIVGIGNIGKALTKNFHFERSGITLVAGFDVLASTIFTKNGPLEIYSVDTLEQYIIDNNIDIGVITVPKELAVEIAKRMEKAGIRGIWNFTSKDLQLEGLCVPIENVHFSDSLRRLSYNMQEEQE